MGHESPAESPLTQERLGEGEEVPRPWDIVGHDGELPGLPLAHTLPHNCWLGIRDIYSLTVLEAGGPKSFRWTEIKGLAGPHSRWRPGEGGRGESSGPL